MSYSRHGPMDGAKARETAGPRPLKGHTGRAKSSGGSCRCQPESQRNGQGRSEKDKGCDEGGEEERERERVRTGARTSSLGET